MKNMIAFQVRIEACSFAHTEKDEGKILSKLFVDSDQRFRFSHVLGGWKDSIETQPGDDEDLDLDDQDEDIETEVSSARLHSMKFRQWVDRVTSMTESAIEKACLNATIPPEQNGPLLDDSWLQYIDLDQVDALTKEIMDEVEKRLCLTTGESSWPVIHRIADTADKAEFFWRLRPFYQNHRRLFGALVTPLVQGIRVRGRLFPPSWAAGSSSAWVILDGQGVDHGQGESTNIDRTIPPQLTAKFSRADVICLVDKAMPAMTGAAPILLEHLITRGYLDRLIVAFTHFEAVAAPDLDAQGRKAKALEGLSGAIQGIGSLPKVQRALLERTAESKTYFFARLDATEITQK
jgi:hypothetical protein